MRQARGNRAARAGALDRGAHAKIVPRRALSRHRCAEGVRAAEGDVGCSRDALGATSERLRATGTSFAASLFPWLEEKWWERFYGDPELEREEPEASHAIAIGPWPRRVSITALAAL
jgi:hypothetical protein